MAMKLKPADTATGVELLAVVPLAELAGGVVAPAVGRPGVGEPAGVKEACGESAEAQAPRRRRLARRHSPLSRCRAGHPRCRPSNRPRRSWFARRCDTSPRRGQ